MISMLTLVQRRACCQVLVTVNAQPYVISTALILISLSFTQNTRPLLVFVNNSAPHAVRTMAWRAAFACEINKYI
jgi:hypothetical protein